MPKIGRTLSYINTERKGKSTEQSSVSQSLGSSRPGGSISMPQGDYLLKSIWDKVFEIRTDSQGTEYIFGKLPMVTQYGITMYSGDGVNVPSLASGLPFDGRTIWYNPNTNQIEVIGGTGGGSGEGVSNFWDLSGIPSWITNSKPKYTYSEIEGTPDLSGFATQNWIISQGYASAEELKKYIPISGYTEVSGEKNFTGGLKVNGSPIYYDTEKKYWKLEGDLLVTGGVTMYGSDSSFTPSTIMDAIAVDGTTISKSGGVLKVIGGTGGGVADSVAWANITGKPTWIGSTKPTYSYSEITGAISTTELQNYLTQNSYLNVTSGDNRYLLLSGGTISSISGNYTPLIVETNSLPEVWMKFKDTVGNTYIGSDKGQPAVYIEGDRNYLLLHSGNYSNYALPLSGGTINGNIQLGNDNSTSYYAMLVKQNGNVMSVGLDYGYGTLGYRESGTTNWNLLSVKNNDILCSFNGGNNWNTLWHSGNDGSGSGLDADLLDGVQESGFCRHLDGVPITSHRGIGYGFADSGWISNGPALSIGYSGDNYLMQLQAPADYTSLHFRNRMNGAWGSWKTIAFTDSNVASATKLQTARTIWGQSFDGSGNVSGNISNTNNITPSKNSSYDIGSNSNQYRAMYASWFGAKTGNTLSFGANDGTHIFIDTSGNVGIGGTNPEYKLHVFGDIRSYNLSTDGINAKTLSMGNYIKLHSNNWTELWVNWGGAEAGGNLMLCGREMIFHCGNVAGYQVGMKLDASSNLLVYGGITMYSDQRKKTILNHVELSLKQIANAPLIEHFYNSDDKKTTHVGSIAQYWANMNDWFCKLDSEGFYTMEIQNAALASAISIARELDRYETKTDKAIKKLKMRICELEEEIERLKSA